MEYLLLYHSRTEIVITVIAITVLVITVIVITKTEASMNGNICDAIATFGPLFIEVSSRLVSSTIGNTVVAKVAGSVAISVAERMRRRQSSCVMWAAVGFKRIELPS